MQGDVVGSAGEVAYRTGQLIQGQELAKQHVIISYGAKLTVITDMGMSGRVVTVTCVTSIHQ